MPIQHKFFSDLPKVEVMQKFVKRHKQRFDNMKSFSNALKELIVTAYLEGRTETVYSLANADIDVDGIRILERQLMELNFTVVFTHPGGSERNLSCWVCWAESEEERSRALSDYINLQNVPIRVPYSSGNLLKSASDVVAPPPHLGE